jgi:hypothetical protein
MKTGKEHGQSGMGMGMARREEGKKGRSEQGTRDDGRWTAGIRKYEMIDYT